LSLADGPRVSAQAESDASFSAETRSQRACDLLPCQSKIDACVRYVLIADQSKDGGIPLLKGILCKSTCFQFEAGYETASIKTSCGILRTHRGRVFVIMHQWECACGTVVFFGGSQHGLFWSTTQSVLTRTLVDVVSVVMAFSGHSTFSSAFIVL